MKNYKFNKRHTNNLILYQTDGCTWRFRANYFSLGSMLVRHKSPLLKSISLIRNSNCSGF